MVKIKAYDIDGREIKKGDLIEIINNPKPFHHWLKEGNKLYVTGYEFRLTSMVVFFESKGSRLKCSQGLDGNKIRILQRE